MIDYAKIFEAHYPGKRYQWVGDTYEGIEWYEDTPKPTQAELDALWDATQAKVVAKAQAAEVAKQASLDKLAKLGLTPEDLKNILG
jgi:hypothetical protein